MKKQALFCVFLIVGSLGMAQAKDPLADGQASYQQGDYISALALFQKLLADPSQKALQGPAYFWIAKTYLALLDFKSADKNLEYYLLNYPKDSSVMEGEYQKGRLLFYQGEFEKSLVALNGFLKKYGENDYTSNALFWMGESAYSLGHFDDAKNFYTRIVTAYPTSFKVEAARYRLALIDLKGREEELIKLLKWSHEESLNAMDEFQRREKSYQQAIISYQAKIKDLQGAGAAAQIAVLEKRIAELEALNKSGKPSTGTATTSVQGNVSAEMKLLDLKEKALALKEYYLAWMEKNGSSDKK